MRACFDPSINMKELKIPSNLVTSVRSLIRRGPLLIFTFKNYSQVKMDLLLIQRMMMQEESPNLESTSVSPMLTSNTPEPDLCTQDDVTDERPPPPPPMIASVTTKVSMAGYMERKKVFYLNFENLI